MIIIAVRKLTKRNQLQILKNLILSVMEITNWTTVSYKKIKRRLQKGKKKHNVELKETID